jgi:hypothetical protein
MEKGFWDSWQWSAVRLVCETVQLSLWPECHLLEMSGQFFNVQIIMEPQKAMHNVLSTEKYFILIFDKVWIMIHN